MVADTGDFQSIERYQPRDATTNPSLILKAVQQDAYRPLLEKTVRDHATEPTGALIDRVLIAFGTQILAIIPGRVSTEVDARLSFDTAATIAKADQLIQLYSDAGISRERVLIKIASTWEGHTRGGGPAEAWGSLQHDAVVFVAAGCRVRGSGVRN